MNADDLADALVNGASGWLVLSVAAVLPMLWTFTLVMHFARPTVIRFLQSLTLRFGGDVWWLSYVLIRDALLVITLGLGMLFFMPNLYFVAGAADHRAALGRSSCSGRCASRSSATRTTTPAAFRLLSILLVIASVLYIVPQIYGLEAADQAYLGDLPSKLISSENLAVARPLFWVSLGLFGLTRGRDVHPGRPPAARSADGRGCPRRRRLTRRARSGPGEEGHDEDVALLVADHLGIVGDRPVPAEVVARAQLHHVVALGHPPSAAQDEVVLVAGMGVQARPGRRPARPLR